MQRSRKLTEPLIHAGIWLACYIFVILTVKTIGPFKRVDQTLVLPVTMGTVINIVLFYVTALFLIPGYSENKRHLIFISRLIALLGILTVAETITDNLFFTYYYSDNQESVYSQFLVNLVLNFVMLSLALGYGFTKNWIRNEEVKQRLTREKLSAELAQLRNQLNPHFLFNVLNMAYSSAARNGDEATADIIEKISGLMRYITYDSNVEKIALAREAEYLENYIALQKMRFSDDLPVTVSYLVEGNTGGLLISPLILVQFVENTFKHGISLGRGSEISISIKITGHQLEFMTTNPVFRDEAGSNGIGILNARKRLEILYPRKHDLSVQNDGIQFKVKLLMNLD